MTDTTLRSYEILLDGKLRTEEDPIQIGKDFRKLQNLRYTEAKTKQGVSGMSKINSTALTYTV